MPKVLDDRVKALMRKGMSEQRAYAIATSSLQKEGKLKKGTQKSTSKGK
jgi:uncharacterized protein YoaH (UPF0181 family)